MQPILQAREEGFDDEEILAFLQQRNQALAEPINQAMQIGYSASEVLYYINNVGPSILRKGQKVRHVEGIQRPPQERGIIPSFKKGFAGSVTGLVSGQPEQIEPEDQGFLESLAGMAGGLVGDVPAMIAGGAAGGAAGTTVVPGIGTVVGAGAGSFALPAIIKQSFAEYRDYAKGGGAGTFGEFLERAGHVGKAGIKSGILGAAVSQASRLLPVLKRMPRFAKLLDTRIGKAIEEPIAELATLTAGEAAIEGKIPTPTDIGKNIFAITGFRLSKAGLGKVAELTKKYTPFEAAARVSSKGQLEQRKVEIEAAESTTETQQQLAVLDREISKREKAAETRAEVVETIKTVGVDLAEKANAMLPERVQKLNESIVEDISQRYQRRISGKEKAKREKFIQMVEQHEGKKSGEMLRSHYKWKDALESPIDIVEGKDVFLSDENLVDMMHYRQRTHNPNIEGDTFEALNKRLPNRAKEIVDDIVDEHFKIWLQRWNDNPATLRKISPREGLEDIYLPGVYEETSKSKYTTAMKHADEMLRNNPDKALKKQFKLNGPFANAKVFETYAQALEEGGLKSRYKNIKDLLRYHDEMMIRLEANNNLMAKLREWQKESGEKVIVNSNNKEAYEQAKKDGWVPFEDKFLRMRVIGTDSEGKPKWEVSPDRALVDPTFAKAFQGVFSKEGYKPEPAFWKTYDAISNLMKVMRVSLSPFHSIALGESGIGGMGLEFFKGVKPLRHFFSENWWDTASKKFGDVDGLSWRAEMGLSFKVPDTSTYEHGQKILSSLSDAIPKKESMLKMPFKKAMGLIQKSHKWIFEEYQPRLKIATFDKYFKDVMERMAKEGKEITPELTEHVARETAKVVNNQFGGQIWETMTNLNLNDPKMQKWMRRAVGFPDWSISAIRQAADAFAPGVRGDLSREYWIRYVLGLMSATYMMRFLYGGFSRDKDKFNWSPQKAFKALETKDPNSLTGFPLPDIELEIAGVKFNPGRDEKGRRLYSHYGKQMFEIPRYAINTVDALFSKSNPLIQSAFKQMFGGAPYKGELFPVRAKYKAGEFMPWDATKPWTLSRSVSRASEFVGEFVPFSFRGLGDKGIATTLATGGGAVPVRKGLSLKSSEPYMIDAVRTKNPRKLKQIINVLKDNGYDEKQIRNRIRLIKKFWVDNSDVLSSLDK